jgi:SAM-dependent methyltransferase
MKRNLLEEIALAGAEHLDPAYVAGYDRKARVDPADDLAELRTRGLGPESTLIDFGAGTGTFAVAAAMIAAIRVRAAEHGVDNVECVRAGFLSYEHTGVPADVVYTRNALHHLPDFWKAVALRRLADVLREGGVLRLRDLVFACDLPEADAVIEHWLETVAVERPEDGWTRSELETHLRDEHSTFSWLLEPMIERAGFEIERADYGQLLVYADYVCVKR